MGNVFGRPQNEGYYRRLQGLCQQIADILRGADPDEVGGLVQAVLLSLELAPEAALAGPLQCWIQALTQRRHSKAMGVFERSMMETLLERYCPGSVGATALAPLAD
jgi:hypothetical protein